MEVKVKRIQGAMEALRRDTIYIEAVQDRHNIAIALQGAGVDPDEEMPEAARWWEIGETPTKGWYHSEGDDLELEIGTFHGGYVLLSYRWHGPHPTEQAAREHYEATKAPATQPTAEYDAGWVEEFYDALLKRDTEWEQDREDLCKEAARRERETWEKKQERLTQLADILNAVGCAARGQSHAYDWREPAPELTDVLDLRAERDRMAAELAAAQPQPCADLAGIVKRMQDLREKRVSDPDIWMLCNAVVDLAQAVVGMGGKP